MDVNTRDLFLLAFVIANTDDDGVFRMSMRDMSIRTKVNYRTLRKFFDGQLQIQHFTNCICNTPKIANTTPKQSNKTTTNICISKELQRFRNTFKVLHIQHSKNCKCNTSKIANTTVSQSSDKKTPQKQDIYFDNNNNININNISRNINTSKKEENTKEEKRFRFLDELIKAGVSEQFARDWVTIRHSPSAKGKTVDTPTALTRIIRQMEIIRQKGEGTYDDCIGMAIDCGWYGFNAQWYMNRKNKLQFGHYGKQSGSNNKRNEDAGSIPFKEGDLSDFD